MARTRRNTSSHPAPAELFPIRTVSNITGVNAVTLRAWERRYGLIEPLRTPSGHRLYGREQIDQIQHILGLLRKGLSIGQVGPALTAPQPGRVAVEEGPWAGYSDRIIGAVARFDEDELEEVYAAALAVHPIETVTDRLLLPVLRELGRRWETGDGTVAEEHFFSVYVRDKLGARFHHRSRGHRGPKVLAACLPGEQHDIGLLVFSLAAHERGLRVVLLAAQTPFEELPAAARRGHCSAVVLSATLTAPQSLIGDQLPAIVAAAGVPVFVGGAASLHSRDAIVAAGASVLGTDIPAAIERLKAVLASSSVSG
jgi:DNA-binding transcriptional MerR regulator/methylmalonyl-CoA mutase cobalamin-binding subunit